MTTYGTGVYGDDLYGGVELLEAINPHLPALTSRIAFTTAPLATPTWQVQEPNNLLGFVVERGRGSELDDFQPGTATLTLDNRDRAYDPTNTSGPNYGNLKPRKRSSLQATWNAIVYDLFDGFVNSWPQKWEAMMGTVELPLTDAFAVFGKETFATALISDPNNPGQFIHQERGRERADQRLAWLLDQAGWPIGWRELSPGVVDQMAYGFAPSNVLNHAREIEDTEGGFLFMSPSGNVVFQDKYFRLNNYATSQATFSDSPQGAELPFVLSDPEQDVEHLVNHATGRRANDQQSPIYETSDATSRIDYGPAAATVELWAAAATEIEARTMYLVDRYKQPLDRIKSITLQPQMDDNLWPHALGRVIGEKITFKSCYWGKGSVQTLDCRIEGIRHEYTAAPLRWTTTFRLSPVSTLETAANFKPLGTAVLGTDVMLIW
jgi:hypothetical protein